MIRDTPPPGVLLPSSPNELHADFIYADGQVLILSPEFVGEIEKQLETIDSKVMRQREAMIFKKIEARSATRMKDFVKAADKFFKKPFRPTE
jgi:hypothetical protein